MPPPPGETAIDVQTAAGAPDTAPVEQTETGTAAEKTVPNENGQVAATDPQGQPTEAAAAAEEIPASGAGDVSAVQTAAVPEADSYRVWLLSADSHEVAEELWQAALMRHETVLATADVAIREVDYGDLGHFYRVLAGPAMDREAALGLCRRLQLDTPETFCKILRQ